MRKLLSMIIAAVVFCMAIAQPAIAADLGNGAKIFSANCASCHAGGQNLVAGPSKSLKQDALTANGIDTVEKVIAQVTNGKGGMPPFKGRLQPADIEDVANYVISQAEQGWPKQ